MKYQQKKSLSRLNTVLPLIVGVLTSLLTIPLVSQAEGLTQEIVQAVEPQVLNLVIGKSVVLNSGQPIKRASLANPNLASTLVLSPTQLYLNGKAIGATNLTFWGKDGNVFAVYDVHVKPDVKRLKTHLYELFPKEKSIQVHTAHDHITLAGSVSGPEIMTQVMGLAETYAPKKVMNLMQVGGVQQVMLEVTVAEMAKGLLKRFGVNFLNQNSRGGNLGVNPVVRDGGSTASRSVQIGLLDNLTDFKTNNDGTLTHLLGATSNLALGFKAGNSMLSVILSVLKQNNLTKILAEPTLIAISGQEANFLAGGQFPVPVPQAFGVTTIKFKQFGVSLNFNPTVLSDRNISLKISPEVSELDFSNGINSQGITIPAILTRKVNTVIELKDGQSFAIAGLIQDNIRESIAKYPFLGDIPILGTLFRSSSFQKNQTELIIIVTPRLVKPLDMTTQTLPTDSYLEPNDFELMLMGFLEGRKSQDASKIKSTSMNNPDGATMIPVVPAGGGLEGQFGHLAP